tara:strand:- start:305 stop:691 length:387 start_codon:yes stop_codon:yes gene_type:complete
MVQKWPAAARRQPRGQRAHWPFATHPPPVARNRQAYAKLGYQTVLAGHWVGKRLGDGIKTDAARRMQRIRDKAPFRLLISIGGAGAQQEFIIQVLGALHAVQVKTAVRFGGRASRLQSPARPPGPISR